MFHYGNAVCCATCFEKMRSISTTTYVCPKCGKQIQMNDRKEN